MLPVRAERSADLAADRRKDDRDLIVPRGETVPIGRREVDVLVVRREDAARIGLGRHRPTVGGVRGARPVPDLPRQRVRGAEVAPEARRALLSASGVSDRESLMGRAGRPGQKFLQVRRGLPMSNLGSNLRM